MPERLCVRAIHRGRDAQFTGLGRQVWWKPHPWRVLLGTTGSFDIARPLFEPRRMLVEFRHVKQEPGGRRRWFEDDGFELIVWQDAGGAIEGFQICYRALEGERALTWRAPHGFSHACVDTGDETPVKNQTPILLPAGPVPWEEIAATFRAGSNSLEPAWRELILQRLSARK